MIVLYIISLVFLHETVFFRFHPASVSLSFCIPTVRFYTGVTTNSATATNCVSLYDLRGIH